MQTIRLVKAKAETPKCELPPSINLICYLCTRSKLEISVKIHRNGVQILQLVFKALQFVYYYQVSNTGTLEKILIYLLRYALFLRYYVY